MLRRVRDALRPDGGRRRARARRRRSRAAARRSSLLGAYRAATDSGYSVVGGRCTTSLWHVAELDLYARRRRRSPRCSRCGSRRAALAPARARSPPRRCSITVLLVVEVAAFASTQSFRIEERNKFYVAPFALIALLGLARATTSSRVAACCSSPRPRRRRAAGGRPVRAVRQHVGRLRHVRPAAVVVAAGPGHPLRAAALRRARRRASSPRRRSSSCRARYALVLPVLVAVYFVLASAVVENGRHGIHQARSARSSPASASPHPDWIDRRVGRDADVSFLWHYTGETRPLWKNEFFNRSVRTRLHRRRARPGGRRAARDAGRTSAATARSSPQPASRRACATRSPTPTSRARRSRATRRSASTLYRVERADRDPDARHRPLPATRGRAARSPTAACAAPAARSRCASAPTSTSSQRPDRDGERARPRRRASSTIAAGRAADARRPAAPGRERRSAPCASPPRRCACPGTGRTDTRKLGAHYFSFDYASSR